VAAFLKGKTLVQFTTGTSAEARQASAWAEDSGITYLDGAIMDYPAKIGGADTMLLLSGDQAAFDRNADTLRLLGGRLTYVGEDPATANVMDGGLLTVYYGCALSFMQSAAMVMAEGIAVERLHDALLHFTPVLTSTFGRCASAIGQNDYTGAEASIAVHAAGVKSLQSRASQRGVDNRLLSLFVDYLAEAQRSGDSANELPAVFKVFQAHSKLAAVAE
jgi:3-hydroxyisobutyrate dehydrogenase-like beta-hydroxyacid dehydrogenase